KLPHPCDRSLPGMGLAALPLGHVPFVDAEGARERCLREAKPFPGHPKPIPKRLRGFVWAVAEEIHDPRNEGCIRLAPTSLPITHAIGRYADLGTCLRLQKPEVKPALSQMIAKAANLLRA